jgi:hypothetical protein
LSPTPTSTPTSTATTVPTRPDWAPESAWNKDRGFDLDAFGKHYNADVAPKLASWAANEARKAQLPQKPEDVQLALPKDFTLPQGVEFKLDPAKPEFAKFRELAVKRGLDADTVSDLMGVYAETLVGSEAQIQTAKQAELAKLGANVTARVDAINTFMTAMVGPDGAKAIGSMLVTANIVTSVEKLMAKFATQGAASFSQAHREPPGQPGRLPQAEADRLSGYEKMKYARQFPQDQFQQKAG